MSANTSYSTNYYSFDSTSDSGSDISTSTVDLSEEPNLAFFRSEKFLLRDEQFRRLRSRWDPQGKLDYKYESWLSVHDEIMDWHWYAANHGFWDGPRVKALREEANMLKKDLESNYNTLIHVKDFEGPAVHLSWHECRFWRDREQSRERTREARVERTMAQMRFAIEARRRLDDDEDQEENIFLSTGGMWFARAVCVALFLLFWACDSLYRN
jgi:hypothetical protein